MKPISASLRPTRPGPLPRSLMAATIAILALLHTTTKADDWPQWRGPHRNGISEERGLLQQWPKEGPKLLWRVNDAGGGYSTPSVVADRIYLLGSKGIEEEFVQVRAVKDGSIVWSKAIGKPGNPQQQPNFPGARSTPTVDGEMLYAVSSDGDLACLETASGNVRWQKSFRSDFGGKPGTWAYSESPLVDGEMVICTPGGSEATMVALNKKDGSVRWKASIPEGGGAAYASPILIESHGRRQYVQLLEKGLVGVDAATGKFLWRYDKPVSRYGANIPSPITDAGIIYTASAGTGGGAVKLKPTAEGFEPESLYFESKLPTAIGGSIARDGFLYGTTGQALLCVNMNSGAIKWEERALGAASLCYADGRLYLHGENGEAALVEASPEGYHERGKFTPPQQPSHGNQMQKAWAYPVVANGRLYLRDLESLWCYDVKAR